MQSNPTSCACGCGENARPGNRFIRGHNAHRSHVKYVVDEEGCWVWQGSRWRHGYARMKVAGKWTQAYRVYYERFVGPIPAGLEIDHLCRNRACVNPAHLEPVTHGENTRRAWAHRRSVSAAG